MKCSNHPTYKGVRYPSKRNQGCPTCLAIYQAVQDSQDNLHPYRSLTTPSFKCDMIHVLTEMSTLMLFGTQPQLFWRKETPTAAGVKEHFAKTYNQLKAWMYRSPGTFTGLKSILYQIFTQHWMGFEAERLRTRVDVDDAPVVVPDVPVDSTTLDLTKKLTLDTFFNEEAIEGDTNGEKR